MAIVVLFYCPLTHSMTRTPPLQYVRYYAGGKLKAGQAMAMDYRLWHRGIANRSPDFRHLMYLKYEKKAVDIGVRPKLPKQVQQASVGQGAPKKKRRVALISLGPKASTQ